MKKRIIALLALSLTPLIAQLIVHQFDSYFIGLIVRIITHIFVPLLAVAFITKISLKDSFLTPLYFKKKAKTISLGISFSIGAIIIILGAFLIFYNLIDFGSIKNNLEEIGVNKNTYPFVALAIVLLNPFLEEYFWRGFVFRAFDKYYPKYSIYTGLLFALHHVIIIQSWFNWWQFLIVTLFLAIIGLLFNLIYKKTGSIYATWFIHLTADLIIVIIGFLVLF